jgi:hypothetical protein
LKETQDITSRRNTEMVFHEQAEKEDTTWFVKQSYKKISELKVHKCN